MFKQWTKEEDDKVIEMAKQGFTTEEIAGRLFRSFKSIAHRRANLMRDNSKNTVEMRSPDKKKKPLTSQQVSQRIISTLQTELENVEAYKPATQSKTDIKGDTLVIQLADLHAGKVVKDQDGNVIYDENIFRTRINILCEQILKLLDHNISKGVPIRDVVILSTGDQANGENIYATQAYEQELAPPKQVMLVVDVITKLIVSLLKRKLPVRFYGVRGNHGRTGKDTDVTSNWDLQIYLILDFWARLVLKNPNLQIKYAETEHMVLDIRSHNYLIRHQCPEQCDSPAGRAKINEWARRHKAEAVAYGHWHHFGLNDVDGVRVIRGGSIVGGDSLSESMAKHSEPIQLVWGVNESHITTFFYAVDLDKRKVKEA
jgi:predicted phosphodiesterase